MIQSSPEVELGRDGLLTAKSRHCIQNSSAQEVSVPSEKLDKQLDKQLERI